MQTIETLMSPAAPRPETDPTFRLDQTQRVVPGSPMVPDRPGVVDAWQVVFG